ncbi:hypothetical protein EON77_22210 [bacterium]|nr:MAG: hypothetical protein EON77_22210 [bacterium]
MNTLQNKLVAVALSATVLAPAMLMPSISEAQSKAQQSKRRQQKKNEWRNIGIASAAAGVYGFVTGNKTIGLIGAAGALYSLDRYEKDRKSQSKIDRQRASLYGRSSFTQNGKRYVRKTKVQNGKRYYYFARA